jgi:hypothetical protein
LLLAVLAPTRSTLSGLTLVTVGVDVTRSSASGVTACGVVAVEVVAGLLVLLKPTVVLNTRSPATTIPAAAAMMRQGSAGREGMVSEAVAIGILRSRHRVCVLM